MGAADPDDYGDLTTPCGRCLVAASAALDGELGPLGERGLHAHLAHCPSCRLAVDGMQRMHRSMRLHAAEVVPDLTVAILAAAKPPRLRHREWIRTSLLTVALTQLALAVPDIFGHVAGTTAHVAHHLGALEAAMALGLLYASQRPVRAFGLLPVAGALAIARAVAAIIDIVGGRVALLGEAHHVLEIAGLVLLWALSGHAPRTTRPGWPIEVASPTRRRRSAA